jgi:hypothetical protein
MIREKLLLPLEILDFRLNASCLFLIANLSESMNLSFPTKLIVINTQKYTKSQLIFWFCLSLTFAGIYGCLCWKEAFSSNWIVQDDARQHVFWMMRFIDRELFPNDLIADYFQSVAPVGYTSLYRLAAAIGIDPLLFNKILPPILGLITSSYFFFLCLELLPVPLAAFIATLVFDQNLWMRDDLASATPRAFTYLILLAFLYYLARRSLFPCLIAIAAASLFYPQCIFLCAGMLIFLLVSRNRGFLCFSTNPKDYYFCAIGLGVAMAVILLYASRVSEFGPVITPAEARQLPEFLPGGRSVFFDDNWLKFWFGGPRSRIFPRSLFTPVTLLLGLSLPLLMRFPQKFPLVKKLTPQIWLLPQLLVVSLLMFFVAHLFIFKLHLPVRYTEYSLAIIIGMATGIAITIIIDLLLRNLSRVKQVFFLADIKQYLSLLIIVSTAIVLIFYPNFVPKFPVTKYKTGSAIELYEFLQKQPKNTLIASLTTDTDNIPTFAQRSILVSPEYAIPYHTGYYFPFRQRVIDLIQAQYSTDVVEITKFIRKYGINFWIVEESSFVPEYIENNPWLSQHQPIAQQAVESLREQKVPLLSSFKDSCSVWQDNNLTVISTSCILSSSS